MHRVWSALRGILVLLMAVLALSCGGPPNKTGSTSNSAAPTPVPPVVSNTGKATPAPSRAPSPAGAAIEVTSTPSGANVILIRQEDGGSGNPQSKGSTPVTITGVAPGKYSITLEKPGFKYFQKDVEVKENKTVKVAASLKRG